MEWPGGCELAVFCRHSNGVFIFGGDGLVSYNDLWYYDMASEQFKWRGNGSISPSQGFPLVPGATWPTSHPAGALWSSKNLLWLFGGGSSSGYLSGDLSTYSDGMLFVVDIALFNYVIKIPLCVLLLGSPSLSTAATRA